MGKTGTGVAWGASDRALVDGNFCTLVTAVEEGRAIYTNIQQLVCCLRGANIGDISYLSIAVITDLPLPAFGLQVLFLILFTGCGSAVAITMEPAGDDIMDNPPRRKAADVVTQVGSAFNACHTNRCAGLV